MTDSTAPDLVAVLPYFFVAIVVYAWPLLWPKTADVFSPVGYTAATGTLRLAASFFAIAAAGSVRFELLPFMTRYSRVELAQTVILALVLGRLAFYAGYYSNFGTRFRSWWPTRIVGQEWVQSRLVLAMVVCGVIFLGAYGYLQSKIGGNIFDATMLGEGKAVWRDDPTITWLNRGVLIALVPIYLVAARLLARPTSPALYAVGIVAVLVGLMVTRLGQRGEIVYMGIVLFICAHYLKKRVPMTAIIALGFVALIISSVLGQYREDHLRDQASVQTYRPDKVLAEHERDRTRFEALAVVFYHFPDRYDYLVGKTWYGLVGMLVPRWLWKDKHTHFKWRDSRIMWNLVGLRIPTVYLGALYANFAWIGIVIGMFLWGGVQRGLYEWLLERSKDPNVVVLYGVLLVYFAPTLAALSSTLQYALPVYLILRFVGVAKHASVAPSPLPARGALKSA